MTDLPWRAPNDPPALVRASLEATIQREIRSAEPLAEAARRSGRLTSEAQARLKTISDKDAVPTDSTFGVK